MIPRNTYQNTTRRIRKTGMATSEIPIEAEGTSCSFLESRMRLRIQTIIPVIATVNEMGRRYWKNWMSLLSPFHCFGEIAVLEFMGDFLPTTVSRLSRRWTAQVGDCQAGNSAPARRVPANLPHVLPESPTSR